MSRQKRLPRASIFDTLVNGFFSSSSQVDKIEVDDNNNNNKNNNNKNKNNVSSSKMSTITSSSGNKKSSTSRRHTIALSNPKQPPRKSFSPEHITHKSVKNVKTSDVDMQAITDRLLCMGRPWENRTSKESRRNNVYDISAVLNKRYDDLYLVFNLSNGRVYPLKPLED